MAKPFIQGLTADARNRLKQAGRKVFRNVRDALLKTAIEAERNVVKNNFTGYVPGIRNRKKLQNRSGRLRRSINHTIKGQNLGELVATVGASDPKARTHEFGRKRLGSRTGKRFIPIPVGKALTAAGVLRKRITSYVGDRFGFIRPSSRTLLFVRHLKRKVKGRKFRTLFVLIPFPSPRIRPRLGIRAAVTKLVPVLRERILAGVLKAFA